MEGFTEEKLPPEFGRGDYEPKDGPERLDVWRHIVASTEPARVDGVMVPVKWAEMLCYLHDDLVPARQAELIGTRTPDVAALILLWTGGRR
jgi:hypothetical protein